MHLSVMGGGGKINENLLIKIKYNLVVNTVTQTVSISFLLNYFSSFPGTEILDFPLYTQLLTSQITH